MKCVLIQQADSFDCVFFRKNHSTYPEVLANVHAGTNAVLTGAGVQLTFSTVAGKTYRVELAPTLTGPWSVLEIDLPGTGAPLQITDTAPPPSTSRFYRILAE